MPVTYTKPGDMLNDTVRRGQDALHNKVTEDSDIDSLSPHMQVLRQYQEAEKRKQEQTRRSSAILLLENNPVYQKTKSLQRKPTYGRQPDTRIGSFNRQQPVRAAVDKTLSKEIVTHPVVRYGSAGSIPV